MTEASELFEKFQEFWRAGKDARLSMECYAGKAWLSLHVHVHQQPPPPQPHLQRRQGPSRLRRRARREAARKSASAAEKAATTCESVQDKSSLNPDGETAEKAANDVTPTISGDEDKTPAAEKADHFPWKPNHQLNVLAMPWPIDNRAENHVLDEICTDEDYRQETGPTPQPLAPPNQCEVCGKSFGSSKALNNRISRNHQPP